MTTPTLEQEIEAQTTGVPVQTENPAAPVAQNNEDDGTGVDQSGKPVEIDKRKAGQIRKQREDEARQASLVASGVALALERLGITGFNQPAAAPAAAPAAPALPDYLDGIDTESKAQWGESLKLASRVSQNAEERAVARVTQAMDAKYGTEIKNLRDELGRNTSSLRNGVASSFSASNQSVQKAQSMEGWDDYMSSEDESGMARDSAYQYWMTHDPAKAAKILNNHATRFIEANKSSVPSGFNHMATPTTVSASPVPAPGVKTASAAAITKLISDEMSKPNPDKDRLAGFREIFDRHAAAKTLVA